MTHKFAVGQIVDLTYSKLRYAAAGAYEIRRQMPEAGSDPRYRIKSVAEKHERVAAESELTLSGEPASVFSSMSPASAPTFAVHPETTS